MVGISKTEEKKELKKETIDSYIDRLSTMYQMAYESYNALLDRNDMLLKTCKKLDAGSPAGAHYDIVAGKLAQAEEIAKQIVEDVHHEAIAIVEYARNEVEGIYDTMDRMLSDAQYELREIA